MKYVHILCDIMYVCICICIRMKYVHNSIFQLLKGNQRDLAAASGTSEPSPESQQLELGRCIVARRS